MSMLCECGGQFLVYDSRPNDDATAIRRRRKCSECGRRLSTIERRVLSGKQQFDDAAFRIEAKRSVASAVLDVDLAMNKLRKLL